MDKYEHNIFHNIDFVANKSRLNLFFHFVYNAQNIFPERAIIISFVK